MRFLVAWGRALWQDFQARRRGERRIAPRGVRGRVYIHAGDTLGGIAARTELKANMSIRVYRAQEEAWYSIRPVWIVVHGEVIRVMSDGLEKE